MAQADSKNSITVPVDTTRRHFLTVAAGASVASVGTLAVAAIATGAPPAALAVDPIYAAIERHKAAALIWDAAVDVRADFPELDMDDEQAKQRDLLDEAVDAAWDPCEQTGIELVTTKPTTHAGMVAAIRYIRIQMRDDGTFMPHGLEFEFNSGSEGDGGETLGWVDAFLDTLASATAALDKAVQS
jgi:hypothetical protein